MTKEKSSVRGRGQEIVGRGVDALFSSPPATSVQRAGLAAAAPSASQTESELEEMLATEARDATRGIETPVPTPPIAAPSPVRSAARPIVSSPGIITGDGVLISDDELFGQIDIPRSEDSVVDNDPFAMPDIDVPPAAPSQPTPSPTPASRPTLNPSPFTPPTLAPSQAPTASPTRSPVTRPTLGPVFSDPTTLPTFAPTPAPTAAPTPAPTAAPSEEQLPPSRPRVQIGGALTEVTLTPSESNESNIRPQDPFTSRPDFPVDDTVQTPRRTRAEAEALATKIDKKRVEALHAQIDQLYQDIPRRISNRPDLTAQTMGMLRQARTLLIEKPYEYVEAEYKVQQALSLYNRIENSEEWGDKYGWRVFWFEVVVFFIFLFSFLALLAFGDALSAYLSKLAGTTDTTNGVFTAVGFWATFVWGGIGGVVGAMYILWTHVSERQDFERQHVMWYIAQPIMGLILGGVTFLIINTGLLSLVGGQEAAEKLRTTVQLFPALIAFIAGFRPQFVFGLLVKIIKVINPNAEDQ